MRHADIESVLGVVVEFARHLLPPTDVQFGDGSLTSTQLQILSLVAHAPEQPSLVVLARTLRLTQGAVTQAVDGLITRGIVEKQPSATDGRTRLLALTVQGADMVSDYESAIVAQVDPWFAELDDADLAELARLLASVRPGRA
ncbi:MarR family winged helix-turn-helix transcriptional regulator [Microbacterium sp. NPDC057407]|uniref:MarR family winged helix-turn-helix transcriptional regulator n=1 Tax=Microbacterium sp. NPDC057407 TaxID=3346120 RepID=UPI00366B354B